MPEDEVQARWHVAQLKAAGTELTWKLVETAYRRGWNAALDFDSPENDCYD